MVIKAIKLALFMGFDLKDYEIRFSNHWVKDASFWAVQNSWQSFSSQMYD